jgi:hypothetical protein
MLNFRRHFAHSPDLGVETLGTDAVSTYLAAQPATAPEIECGHCNEKLPLRMSQQGEQSAVWLCAECSVPFVSVCIKDRLESNARNIKLDNRYFDTEGLPPISPKLRREVIKMAEREADALSGEHRRSQRVSQSLVVPAVKLNANFNPTGRSFQIMVANVSREGIGLVHPGPIDAEYIALKLTLDEEEPIQVVTRLVRQRELQGDILEFGGEFYVRLGSVLEKE